MRRGMLITVAESDRAIFQLRSMGGPVTRIAPTLTTKAIRVMANSGTALVIRIALCALIRIMQRIETDHKDCRVRWLVRASVKQIESRSL